MTRINEYLFRAIDFTSEFNGTGYIITDSPAGYDYRLDYAEDFTSFGVRVSRWVIDDIERDSGEDGRWMEVVASWDRTVDSAWGKTTQEIPVRDESIGESQAEALGQIIDRLTMINAGIFDDIADEMLIDPVVLAQHPDAQEHDNCEPEDDEELPLVSGEPDEG